MTNLENWKKELKAEFRLIGITRMGLTPLDEWVDVYLDYIHAEVVKECVGELERVNAMVSNSQENFDQAQIATIVWNSMVKPHVIARLQALITEPV